MAKGNRNKFRTKWYSPSSWYRYAPTVSDDKETAEDLNRKTRDYLMNQLGDTNLEKYNEKYKARIEGIALAAYKSEAAFANHIANDFLVSYKGYPYRDPAIGGLPGINNSLYGEADSSEAKALRAALAEKINAHEALLQEGIHNKVNQKDLTALHNIFKVELHAFIEASIQQIANHGPIDAGMAPLVYGTFGKDMQGLRKICADFEEEVNTHFDKKLAVTRQMQPDFQLWSDVDQLKVTGDDAEQTCEEALNACKNAYQENLFQLLNSLDNDPYLVVEIKALQKETHDKLQEILSAHPAVTVTVDREAKAETIIDGIKTDAVAEHSVSVLTRLAEVSQKAVHLRADMNESFDKPRLRLQQWRHDYDQGTHDKAKFAENAKKRSDITAAFDKELIKTAGAINGLTPTIKTVAPIGDLNALLAAYQAFVAKPDAQTAAELHRLKSACGTHKTALEAKANETLVVGGTLSDAQIVNNKAIETAIALKNIDAVSAPKNYINDLFPLEQRLEKLHQDYSEFSKNPRPVKPVAPLDTGDATVDTAAQKKFDADTLAYNNAEKEYKRLTTESTELKTALTAAAPEKPVEPADLATNADAKKTYDAALATYNTDLKTHEATTKSQDSITSFYRCAAFDQPNFADFTAEYNTLSSEIKNLQQDYTAAVTEILKIESRFNPTQARHDLQRLESDYKTKFEKKTAALTILSEKVTAVTDPLSQTNKDAFNAQITALQAAQAKAFTNITTEIKAQREAASRAYEEYALKYELFILLNGQMSGLLTTEQKQAFDNFNVIDLLKNLHQSSYLDDRFTLGNVSLSKAKGGGYHVHLSSEANIHSSKNRFGKDATWLRKVCFYFFNATRTAEIHSTLTDPIKINSIGKLFALIVQEKTQKDAKDDSLTFTMPNYSPEDYDTLLSWSMAAIAHGIKTDHAANFDQSFKGTEDAQSFFLFQGLKDGADRKRIRGEFLEKIENYKKNFEAAKDFNHVCTEVLKGGLRAPGVESDINTIAGIGDLRQDYQQFLSAAFALSHYDKTTAGLLAAGNDAGAALRQTIHQLKNMDLTIVKGLDDSGNQKQAASLLGVVMPRDSAIAILAIKEREIIALHNAIAMNPGNEHFLEQVDALTAQLKKDYRHIGDLIDECGVGKEGHLDVSLREALNRIADAAGRGALAPINITETTETTKKTTVMALQSQGFDADTKLKDPISRVVGNAAFANASAKLDELGKLLTQVEAGREVGNAKTDSMFDQLGLTAEQLTKPEEFVKIDFSAKAKAYLEKLDQQITALGTPIVNSADDKKLIALKAEKEKVNKLVTFLDETKKPVAKANTEMAEIKEALQNAKAVYEASSDATEAYLITLKGAQTQLDELNKGGLISHHQKEYKDLTAEITDSKDAVITAVYAKLNTDLEEKFATLTLDAINENLEHIIRLHAAIGTEDHFVTQKTQLMQLSYAKNILEKPVVIIDDGDFYKNPTDRINALKNLQIAINESPDLSKEHKAAITAAINQQIANVLTTVKAKVATYDNALPEQTELTHAKDFFKNPRLTAVENAYSKDVARPVSSRLGAIRSESYSSHLEGMQNTINETKKVIDTVDDLGLKVMAEATIAVMKQYIASIVKLDTLDKKNSTPAQLVQKESLKSSSKVVIDDAINAVITKANAAIDPVPTTDDAKKTALKTLTEVKDVLAVCESKLTDKQAASFITIQSKINVLSAPKERFEVTTESLAVKQKELTALLSKKKDLKNWNKDTVEVDKEIRALITEVNAGVAVLLVKPQQGDSDLIKEVSYFYSDSRNGMMDEKITINKPSSGVMDKIKNAAGLGQENVIEACAKAIVKLDSAVDKEMSETRTSTSSISSHRS